MPYLFLMYTRSACTYAPGIEFVSSSSTRGRAKGTSEEDEKAEVPPSPSPPVMVILPSWEDVCFRKRSLGGNAPLVVDDDVDALALDLEDDHDAAPSRLTTAGRGTRSLSGVILHS